MIFKNTTADIGTHYKVPIAIRIGTTDIVTLDFNPCDLKDDRACNDRI
jgi:hypothetical protein